MISLNLDLPEMEQVILFTLKRLLKNGEIREVARDKVERNRDYFDLVTGECAFIAAEVFSYLLLCQTIRLAAYIQRPKARETDPIDTYILDLKFTREELKAFNPETTPMHVPGSLRGPVPDGGGLSIGADRAAILAEPRRHPERPSPVNVDESFPVHRPHKLTATRRCGAALKACDCPDGGTCF
jgi:hypothetical protein